MEVKELKKTNIFKLSSEKYTEELKKLRKEYEVMKKGMFEFIDAQGGWLEFSIRFFPGEPLKTIKLTHGEICDLPMGIIKHLNNTKKKVRMFSKELGQRGLPSTYTVQSRCRFTPVDVM
jgi:hypothetical protein